MKHLLCLLLIASTATAQTPITQVDNPIEISLGRDTIDNVIIKKSAEFEALLLNRRSKTVTLQWVVKFKTNQSDVQFPIKPMRVELTATENKYNIVSTGAYAGNLQEVLSKYGYPVITVTAEGDTLRDYQKDAQGRYLTSVAVQDQWSYYQAAFDQQVRLRQLIRQVALQAHNAAEIDAHIRRYLNSQ